VGWTAIDACRDGFDSVVIEDASVRRVMAADLLGS
jgi:hypothetical protein